MQRLFLLLQYVLAVTGCHNGIESAHHFSNQWVVRLQGGPAAARVLADELGYNYEGPVLGFTDTYLIAKLDHPRMHKRAHHRLTARLIADARVLWAEQQFSKIRSKRRPPAGDNPGPSLDDAQSRTYDDVAVPPRLQRMFNDELWGEQWYLQDTRTRADLPKLDLHVLLLYQMGVTGRGVRVCVLDDGVEHNHDDLKENYDPEISYDVNDGDNDPAPRYDEMDTNAHGTRCAGEIAMTANNRKCGVGVAFNSRIGGVRLLDGEVNDCVEGTALGYAYDKVDIYSASWGPNDDGMTVEGPGRLATEAMERGIMQGRDGKGVIYVWASGNGGAHGDHCNCDGYVASIYTLSVGSASQHGDFPWYGERCASTLAVTYSSGAYTDQMIATTDLKNTCTVTHTGTSASAPLAAGIIALALEVNPQVTWRDVQHLVTWTSQYAALRHNMGWTRNGAGAWVSTRFGFGLMDAGALVAAAANWTTVPHKSVCGVSAKHSNNVTLRFGRPVFIEFDTDGCQGSSNEVRYLEHVEVKVNIYYPVRGSLEVLLTSGAGTQVQLLERRKLDNSSRGFVDWKFMSVLTWGEDPAGLWTLEIRDEVGPATNVGSVAEVALLLHGTKQQPEYRARGPRQYDDDYNRVHRKTTTSSLTSTTTLNMLRQAKNSDDLQWEDIVGVPLELERSLASRSSAKINWLRQLFRL